MGCRVPVVTVSAGPYDYARREYRSVILPMFTQMMVNHRVGPRTWFWLVPNNQAPIGSDGAVVFAMSLNNMGAWKFIEL